MDWKKLISQTVGQEQLGNLTDFVQDKMNSGNSPIDDFYNEVRTILALSAPSMVSTDWHGSMNAIAIISTTENYFRSILGKMIIICPQSKKKAAENNINFGSVLWHPNESIERGAFEHVSFSDSKKIIEMTRKYIGTELNKSDLVPILNEFNKICELRHGIVHSARILAGKNALMLDLPSSNKEQFITIGYGQLQKIASICTTLVVSYNQKLFEVMANRWATSWRNPTWTTEIENEYFKKTWRIFHSKIDKANNTIPESGSWVKCKNLIKTEYQLS
ncbi:hypothetical protein [Tenacibaculum ovolyticum]|uniref:hypothetical protein n=1 Tax=Tenacibaculum ovolyticum TaxID=104270 RepID=UPI00042A184B|nr:hypothetical protein [Tenacibaculum ovolyticum]